MKNLTSLLTLVLAITCLSQANAQDNNFARLVGDVKVGDPKPGSDAKISTLIWGGDIPLIQANGGKTTTQTGSYFDKQGWSVTLTPGDDYISQTKEYLQGDRVLIRGTFGMLGMSSEVLGADPRTKPTILVQYTYSLGDHIVGIGIKNLNELKDFEKKNGRKPVIVAQQGGPHVVLIYESLNVAKMTKDDIEIIWVTDLTGPKGPAAYFRNPTGKKADLCCVITPDMLGLCSGLDQVGSGLEGTVKDARVVNSTSVMSRVIVDVIAARTDWYTANKDKAAKFVAAYLKAVEDVVKMRREYDESGSFLKGTGPTYKALLTEAQAYFGKEAIPTIEEDGHGLLLDASFVGLPGQIAFFEDTGNLQGFDKKQSYVLDMATEWGYASKRTGFNPPRFDYREIAKLAGVEYRAPQTTGRIRAESLGLTPDSIELSEGVVSFTIPFQPEQMTFSADTYGADFDSGLQTISRFGNAILAVKGHSDPTRTLVAFVKAGLQNGTLTRQGNSTQGYTYFINTTSGRKQLDLTQVDLIVKLIESGSFDVTVKFSDGTSATPRDTLAAALSLSKQRAEAVKKAIIQRAEEAGVTLDESQIQPIGVGILQPVISKPSNAQEQLQNMRVEFQVTPVKSEALPTADFDF